MNQLLRRRSAALFEVVGVYLTGAALNDKIVNWLTDRRLISSQNPFDLLTTHTSNAELLVASRQLFLALVLIYLSFFLLILPIDWWRKHRGSATYGLTRAGCSWKTLIVAGIATAALTEWPVLMHTLVDAIHPLGAMAPWRQAFFDMRGGAAAIRQVFAARKLAVSMLLAIAMALYAVTASRVSAMTWVAFVLLLLALTLEAIDRGRSRTI